MSSLEFFFLLVLDKVFFIFLEQDLWGVFRVRFFVFICSLSC